MKSKLNFLHNLNAVYINCVGRSQSRLQQLIDWCGGTSFDGCLIFDECHKAKHYVPVSFIQENRDLYSIGHLLWQKAKFNKKLICLFFACLRYVQ